MKKALFLLIAAGILFSQFNLSTRKQLKERCIVLSPIEKSDNSTPPDPMEKYPEESENEDSKEIKDNDSKKWDQYRFLSKVFCILTKTAWSIHDAKPAIKPYVSKIQQPPEGTFVA